MRVDVFLKSSRLVKRRALAKEFCEEGAVLVNGHPARAGREIQVGDALALNLRSRRLLVEVLDVPARPPSAGGAAGLYRVLSDVPVDPDAPRSAG